MVDKSLLVTILFGINLALFGFLLYANIFAQEKQAKINQILKIKKQYNYDELFPTITYSKSDKAEVSFKSVDENKTQPAPTCINAEAQTPKEKLAALKTCLPLFKEYHPTTQKEVKRLLKDVPNFVPKFGEAPSVVSYPFETVSWKQLYKTPLSKQNVLNTLGFYTATFVPKSYYDDQPEDMVDYTTPHYGIFNMDDYCNVHDILVMFSRDLLKKKYFVTDYHHLGLPRMFVMNAIGEDLMPKISKNMHKINFYQKLYPIDFRTNMFYFKKADFHNYHELGRHFSCYGQSYNHIPGHGGIVRKDLMSKNSMDWMHKFASNPKCQKKINFFPIGYRLNIESECKEFFKVLSSKEYLSRPAGIKKFIMKVGFGVHRGAGVRILDDPTEKSLREQYENGEKCGTITVNQVAQEYIDPPLLFEGHKFDLRIYMLVASTNPLRIFYHDGFLRVSLDKYESTSNKDNIVMTNTELSKAIIKQCEKTNTTYNGKTADQLREFQMQSLEDLEKHLLAIGKITDKNWLNNYLRPEIKRSFLSSIKMIQPNLHKSSNFFEQYGVDIILDSNMNIKILEINASPMIIGTTKRKTELMKNMLMGQFNIIFAQQFSRTERTMKYLDKNIEEIKNKVNSETHLKEFMSLYANDVEPEYAHMLENNPWQPVYDASLSGKDRFFGLYEQECIDMIDQVVQDN